MTLPRDVSSPREVADRLDAGVQVRGFNIPELVVAPTSPDYGRELLHGMLAVSASAAGGVFTDVSVRVLYVETLTA